VTLGNTLRAPHCFASKVFSFTPGFSPVLEKQIAENRFNGFPDFAETVKTVHYMLLLPPG